MKTCISCKTEKDLSDFGKNKNYRDGYEYYCLVCSRIKHRKYDARRVASRYQYHRAANIRRDYGISLQDYEVLLEKQEGVCAICGTKPPLGKRPLSVDHDHSTGSIRGLLCNGCNVGLGFFKESSEILTKAMTYLAEKGIYSVVK